MFSEATTMTEKVFTVGYLMKLDQEARQRIDTERPEEFDAFTTDERLSGIGRASDRSFESVQDVLKPFVASNV